MLNRLFLDTTSYIMNGFLISISNWLDAKMVSKTMS